MVIEKAPTGLVSISGPPMAGKTTLALELSRVFSANAEIIPDLPRQALEVIGSDITALDPKGFQDYIGFRQLIEENSPLKQCIRILDKSLIDAAAYWRVLVGGTSPVWLSQLTQKRYALVVVCDHTTITPCSDPISQIHAHLRDELSLEIARYASQASERVIVVSGSPVERAEMVRATLSAIGVLDPVKARLTSNLC